MSKKKLNHNAEQTLAFMANYHEPMSVAEMRKEGLKIPRTSLFATMDILADGLNGRKLIDVVTYQDGRTSFRFMLSEDGRKFAQWFVQEGQ